MWTDEEDEQLRALVAEYGVKKWALISTKMAAKGAKQCRRRWQNYLNNDIKQGGWSEEEDRILLEGHRLHGNKWTEIARMVTGRTDNAVKNRHAVLVKKEEKKVEDSRGGGTPSGSGKRKRAPFQPPDASSPKRGSCPTASDNSPSGGSWRPKLSVKIPGASGTSGMGDGQDSSRGDGRGPPSSHKAPPSLEALPTSASLTQVEIELLKQVQDLISPRAEGLGLGLGPEPAKAAAPQTPLDTPTVDMQAVMNWILSVTPRAGAGGGAAAAGTSAPPAKKDDAKADKKQPGSAKAKDGEAAGQHSELLRKLLTEKLAGSDGADGVAAGAKKSPRGEDGKPPASPNFTSSELNILLNALGGGGETPTSGLTGGVNPFGRAADSEPAPAEKEKAKEKEKGKVKAHNTRSPRATRSRK